jgi:uncharacterized DUF497 family protein
MTKARTNFSKHGISFEAACYVFEDVFAWERPDSNTESAEDRIIITGMANGVPLTVVFTERGDRIRIISARKATGYEQEEYYRGQEGA